MGARECTAGPLPAKTEEGAAMEDRLAARRLLYAVFQVVFGSAPDADRLAFVDEALVRQALELAETPASAGFWRRLHRALEDPSGLQGAYTRLFEGPGKLAAAPWESAYRTSDGALFQLQTLAVREVYRSHGMLPEGYPRVADDHIALELDFLGRLGQRMLDAFDGERRAEGEGFRQAARTSRDFLAEHVLKWVGEYAADLAGADEGGLYGAAAPVLADFLRNDFEFLERLVAEDDR